MSILIYNEVVLLDIKTNSVSQTPEYTEDGVDYLYTKVVVDVTAIWSPWHTTLLDEQPVMGQPVEQLPLKTKRLNTKYPTKANAKNHPDLFPSSGGTREYRRGDLTSQEKMVLLRDSLLSPRKELYFSTTHVSNILTPAADLGAPLLHVLPATKWTPQEAEGGPRPSYDCQNGPTPQNLDIKEILGTETYIVSFRIQTCLVDIFSHTSDVKNNRPGGERKDLTLVRNRILAHRWSEEISIDELGYSSKKRTGKLYLRAGPPYSETDGYFLRACITPGLSDGFIRKSSNYSISSDALVVSYNFQDNQEFLMSREPMVRVLDGSIDISAPLGGVRTISVTVTAKGEYPYYDGFETTATTGQDGLKVPDGAVVINKSSNEFTLPSKRGMQIVLNYAMWIALSKITMGSGKFASGADAAGGKYPMLQKIQIKQHLFRNESTVTISALQTTTNDLNLNPLRTPTGWNHPSASIPRLVVRKSPVLRPPVMGASPVMQHKVRDRNGKDTGKTVEEYATLLQVPFPGACDQGFIVDTKTEYPKQFLTHTINLYPVTEVDLKTDAERLKLIFSEDGPRQINNMTQKASDDGLGKR